MTIHDEGNVTDLTRYMSKVGDELYTGSLAVSSGDDFEGETYIDCLRHGVAFDVSEASEARGQGIVELIRFIYQHREC